MKVLIAGGSGFMGTALTRSLRADGHEVWVLTRHRPAHSDEIRWDGRTTQGWSQRVQEMDAVCNITGYGLEHWPWTRSRKQRFIDSRVLPGRALASAIQAATRRPRVFLQISGINHYGLRGEGIADESAPPGDDFLAQLTVQWEAATQPVEESGVRRIVARSAVVLDRRGGLLPLMALPVRLLVGGPLGSGRQAMPWIHLADHIAAIRFLLDSGEAQGAYNLIAPTPTSNAEFMRALAGALHRSYWLPTPEFLLHTALGEMSVLVAEGRYCQPRRLLELGYRFRFPTVGQALQDLFSEPD